MQINFLVLYSSQANLDACSRYRVAVLFHINHSVSLGHALDGDQEAFIRKNYRSETRAVCETEKCST